jgi:hypothetical protein
MSGRLLMLRIAGALLFLSLAATTLPRLVAIVDTARTLMPLPYEARRERQMGTWYASVERLRRELPANEPIALVASPHDIDAAVFANYYLYPIRARLFVGRNNYRNATPDPTRPKTIVAVSGARVERTTYEILRDRDLRAGHRVVSTPHFSEPLTTFILPIATSQDGPTPETFVIEATIVNSSPQRSLVDVSFLPKKDVRHFTIEPGASVSYYDFVYQLFGITGTGWMSINSTAPIRAAFYFVNRGRGDATLLPTDMHSASEANIPTGPLYRDSKLFLIYPYLTPTVVTVNGDTFFMSYGDLVIRPIRSVPAVSGDVLAFVTTRELNGRTDFLWPQ